jgi:hypothetical protein
MFKITVKQIDDIVTAYKELREIFDAAEKLGCIDINGKLFEKTWKLYDRTSKPLDPEGWIDWYIWENDCGVKGYECTFDGKTIAVTNTTQLTEIINS